MACDNTAEYIGNQIGMLKTLAVVASTRNENSQVQTRAALALTKFASGITSKMSCYLTLTNALTVTHLYRIPASRSAKHCKSRIASPKTTESPWSGMLESRSAKYCESKLATPKTENPWPDKSEFSIHSRTFCVSSDFMIKDRENAMRAIMHLTNEDMNCMIMCQKTVLDALLLGACTEGPKWDIFFESAVVALERLASEHINRPVMAGHPGMLVAVAKVIERGHILEDAGTVAKYERLAKSLLTSLLLAL